MPTTRRKATPAKETLAPMQRRFVDEYLIDLNATQAAIRAGYSAKTAQEQGSRLLSKVMVSAAIAAGMAARSERTGVTADAVLRELWAIATVDTNEIVEYRRTCCRHCYGTAHGFQRTPREMDLHRQAWEERLRVTSLKLADGVDVPEPAPFDEQGGDGFDARKEPNPTCPECFGEGVGAPFFKDTRGLSVDARRLYAGVKQTKEGLELKVHDKSAALVNVGKHLGMFAERTEITGRNGKPIEVQVRIIREGRRVTAS